MAFSGLLGVFVIEAAMMTDRQPSEPELLSRRRDSAAVASTGRKPVLAIWRLAYPCSPNANDLVSTHSGNSGSLRRRDVSSARPVARLRSRMSSDLAFPVLEVLDGVAGTCR
jgi:hypothetical protein